MLEDNPLDKKRPNPTSFPFVVDGGIIRSLRSFSNEVGAQPLGLFLCQHSLAIHDSFLGNGMRVEEWQGFRFGKSLDLLLLMPLVVFQNQSDFFVNAKRGHWAYSFASILLPFTIVSLAME